MPASHQSSMPPSGSFKQSVKDVTHTYTAEVYKGTTRSIAEVREELNRKIGQRIEDSIKAEIEAHSQWREEQGLQPNPWAMEWHQQRITELFSRHKQNWREDLGLPADPSLYDFVATAPKDKESCYPFAMAFHVVPWPSQSATEKDDKSFGCLKERNSIVVTSTVVDNDMTQCVDTDTEIHVGNEMGLLKTVQAFWEGQEAIWGLIPSVTGEEA